MNKRHIDYSLYLVTDHYVDPEVFCAIVEQAVRNGVTLLQLREKTASTRNFFELALRVKQIASLHQVPLIINDRVDVALAVDADGVHVGQEDLPVAIARHLLGPDKILGATAATVEGALKAEADGADYIGSGAVYPTTTKFGKVLLPLDTLAKIKQAVGIPVVAIGGINAENLLPLREIGVDGVAVVSAIMNSSDPENATRQLIALWRGYFQ